ncbi:MFS transporter [Bartonella sp. DGB2]|uniref:MFS transporter n=1 Tax=Bartonella sp. DGB2 TaxID=3388426 RepID=UPI00398FB455
MLSFAGSFALYTFISPILINITNLSVAMASGLLLCYGVGAAVGNIAAGRLIDQRGMDQISVLMVSGVSLTLLLSAFFLSSPVAMGLVIGILGFATYGAIPPLQSRMLMLAQRYVPDAIDIASGMNIAAFNTGVAAGSVLGGASARYGGLSILPWISAGISILALTALFLQIKSKSMRAINKKNA